MVFQESEKLPNHLTSFLGNDDNKTCLNNVIAQHAANPLFWLNSMCEVAISYSEQIWTKSDEYKEIFQPWLKEVHEEADNRIMAHIANMLTSFSEMTKIQIRTVDTNVLPS